MTTAIELDDVEPVEEEYLTDEEIEKAYDEYISAVPTKDREDSVVGTLFTDRRDSGPFDYGYENLCDVFVYADILECTWDRTHDMVDLLVKVRRTGEIIHFEGLDVDDVVSQALDKLQRDEFLVNMILEDYDISLPELRELVAPPATNQRELTFDPVMVSAGQPLVFVGADDHVYVGAYIPTPID